MVRERFLNEELCKELRKVVNSSSVFYDDEKLHPLYNLICAAMDRIDSAVRYLNLHCECPESEEDFICFVVFSCMVVDGVKKLLENVTKCKSKYKDEKKYFKKYCMIDPINCSEKECPTDDRFFEHFRSLAFAHPYETSRNEVFREKFGIQVSPWVAVNKIVTSMFPFKEAVGVRVYTEKKTDSDNDMQFIMFSFIDLKKYIISRYEEIESVTQWAKESISSIEEEWKKTKVNRNQDAIDILKEIKTITEQRYMEIYPIDEVISYMECELTDDSNNESVNKYKEYVIGKLDNLCDAMDELDYEKQYNIEDSMTRFNLRNLYPGFDYQIVKIYSNLGDDDIFYSGSDMEWGLLQAKEFYESFGKKWVNIDTRIMSNTEIKLLVTTACYLESVDRTEGDTNA